MRALLLVTLLFAGCGEEETYLVVSVDRRPAVHDPRNLKVTLSNAGSMLTDDLDIGDATFPVTFSLSAPGRAGALEISVDALDFEGKLVGRGTGATELDEMTASVMLDSADFVVNNEYVMDQYLTSDYEAVGFQLAALSTGEWTATFRDECTMCDVYARRYDANGLPVTSELAAGDIAFKVSTKQTTNAATPAVAAGGLTTLLFWDFTESTGGARGIACRGLTETGAAAAPQVAIATDPADVVSAAPLSNGNFVAVWQMFQTSTYTIRSLIVGPSCSPPATLPAAPFTVSTDSGTLGAQRANVAANGGTILYAWIVDGSLRTRVASLAGACAGGETVVLPKTGSQEVEHVRLSPWQDGFAIAVRWASTTTDGPGRIEVHRTNAAGVVMGGPILITDQSRSDFASNKGFSIAQRSDGALLVVWHVCGSGAGLCDVFGRILRPTGAPVGQAFEIPTSTASEQINPSVVALQDAFVAAWNDSSGEAPDSSGTAVRARILYPIYDDARGVHGATCGASAPGAPECAEGLACAMGTDGVQRCYATCTPPSCPGGGTCSTIDATTSACTF